MYTSPGYLVFAREGALMAQHFDAATLQLRDEPVRIAEQVLAWQEIAAFSISENGILAYREGDMSRQRFQWRDRAGKPSADMGEARSYVNFDLSPDASRIVAAGPPGGLYLIDGPRNVTSVLSVPDPSGVGDPIWSSDGRFIVFDRSMRHQIVRIPANGGSETILYEGDSAYQGPYSEDWSKDGRFLLGERTSSSGTEIIALPLAGDSKPISVVKDMGTAADEPHFSPDSRWIAYNSDESGRHEVYVIPFPHTGERWQVSTNGGVQARWRGDGRELFYLDREGMLMAADIKPGPSFQNGVPHALFKTGLRSVIFNQDRYAVTSDGRRFLLLLPDAGGQASIPITVVLNWTSLLKK